MCWGQSGHDLEDRADKSEVDTAAFLAPYTAELLAPEDSAK